MNARISVLVLEKKDDVAESLQSWIRKKGYYLVKIDRAETIVPLIDSRDKIYTIVLVDDFPIEGSFIENLKILKQLAPHVPIVATTESNSLDKEKGMKLGATDYIVKPFAIKDFLARIEKVLQDKKTPHNSSS